MSMRWKIIIIFTLLIALPTGFLGYTNYKNASAILTQELQTTSEQMVNRTVDTMNIFMDSMEETLTALSLDPNVQQLHANPDSREWMLKSFEAVGSSHKDIMHVYIGTPDKEMLIYPTTVDLGEGFDPTTRPWYIDAIRENQLIWTDVYVDDGTKTLVISAAKPVYNLSTNEFVGVLSLDLSLDVLADLINSAQLGTDGYTILSDVEGVTLVHPNKDTIGETIPIDTLLNAITTQQRDTLDYTYEGDSRFAVFNTLERTGWKIIGIMQHAEIEQNASILLKNTLINGGIALAIAILIGLILSTSITKSLVLLVEDMKKVGAGDFTVKSKIQSRDEIGQLAASLNAMIGDLGSLVKNVQTVSENVSLSADALAATAEETSASTEEVTRTVEEIAQGASDQASESEKGSIMTSQLGEKFDELESSSYEMLKASEDVVTANQKGLAVIEDLKQKNVKNNDSIRGIEGAISDLDAKAQSIGAILQTISNIAEQTNLLALNAAIEAARAGEAGKGFSVVAEEIRKLAEQSGRSTEEIRNIITAIQQESNNTVSIMTEVVSSNKERDLTVQEVSVSFAEISNAIEIINKKINRITDYVVSMSKDKDEIVNVIGNISAVSEETAASSEEVTASMQQTASAVEEIARAAEDLNSLAEKLNEGVKRFKG